MVAADTPMTAEEKIENTEGHDEESWDWVGTDVGFTADWEGLRAEVGMRLASSSSLDGYWML